MPSPFPCRPVIRQCSWKKTQIEKKITPWNAVWVNQNNHQYLILVSQVLQSFCKLLWKSFHSLFLLNRCFSLSFLLDVPQFLSLFSLLLFLRWLSISIVHTKYLALFRYIIKKQFHVRSAIFLQVRLMLLLLMLKQHSISLLSDFSSSLSYLL